MSSRGFLQGEDAVEMLLKIRMDGFVTGYASAILTLADGHPNAEQYADMLADEAAAGIEADPILLEAQRREVIERLAGVNSGPITLHEVPHE